MQIVNINFVYNDGKLIGAGRALADGVDASYICDVTIHPDFQGFAPLDMKIVLQVVGKFIGDLETSLNDKKVKITITKKAKEELGRLGYDKEMGARPLIRVIRDKIKLPLSEEILFGKLKNGGDVKIDFKEEFVFLYELKK